MNKSETETTEPRRWICIACRSRIILEEACVPPNETTICDICGVLPNETTICDICGVLPNETTICDVCGAKGSFAALAPTDRRASAVTTRMEALGRLIAAEKMNLLDDALGKDLPDYLWKQAEPLAIAMMTLIRRNADDD